MTDWTPYLGSLKAPKSFTKDYDEGRRYEFRGFGHLLVLMGAFGLATSYASAVLIVGLIIGLVTLLRGYMPARSSDEWAETDPEFAAALQSPSRVVRTYANAMPVFAILLIVGFGVSLAGFLMETKLFMVGIVGMVSCAAAFFLLLRRD